MSITAKSVIFDIADNYLFSSHYINLRSVEFWLNGSKIAITSGYTAYATTIAGGTTLPAYLFNTSLSKINGSSGTQWQSEYIPITGQYQRVIVVFDTPLLFDQIVVNNGHYYGTILEHNAKNVVITTSTDTITSTVYNDTITNATVIFDGVFDQHVAANVEDDQILALTLPPIFIGFGGAIAGSSAEVHNSYYAYTGIGGSVVSGNAIEVHTLRAFIVGSGGVVIGGLATVVATNIQTVSIIGEFGAIAGGTSVIFSSWMGSYIQFVPELSGIANTEIRSFGNVLAKTTKLLGIGVTVTLCTGAVYQPRVMLSASIGSAINVRQYMSSITGVARTDNITYGQIIVGKPSIIVCTGSTGTFNILKPSIYSMAINDIPAVGSVSPAIADISGAALTDIIGRGNITTRVIIRGQIGANGNIVQPLLSLSATATMVVISRGNFDSPLAEVSSSSLVGSVLSGNIMIKIPSLSGTVTADDYATGYISALISTISGNVHNSLIVDGNIAVIHPYIYGQVAIGTESNIIKYRRNCHTI